MKVQKLSNVNMKAVKSVSFGYGAYTQKTLERRSGDEINHSTVLSMMWETNTLQGDVIATKNNNHKVKIIL